MRYFKPGGLKRKALIFGPSFTKARFEGAKKVPPVWVVVSLRDEKRPVFVRASSRVLNSVGTRLMMLATLKGGMRILSMPWMTPLVAKMSTATMRE